MRWIVILLAVALVAATFMIAKLLMIAKALDPSIQPATPTRQDTNIWLVTYAGGDEANLRNARTLIVGAVDKGVDFFKIYSRKDLDKDFSKRNAAILDEKRGAGYWLWKPYVVLDALKNASENDIVIYIDGGAMLLQNIEPFIDLAMQHEMVLFKNIHNNRHTIKRDTVMLMGMEDQYKKLQDMPQLQAGILFFKNTPRVRALVGRWLKYAQNPRILTDQPSVYPEYSNFVMHRHDQAVLTLCYYQTPFGVLREPAELDQYVWVHRRRDNLKHRTLFLLPSFWEKADGWWRPLERWLDWRLLHNLRPVLPV